MQEEHEGIVIETSNSWARVKASRHSDCENCGACPGDSAMVMDVRNPLGAVTGQHVWVRVPEANMVKAAFIVFVLPLASVATGALIGGSGANFLSPDWESIGRIIGGLCCLLLSVGFIIRYDRRAKRNEAMTPVIVRVKI